MFDAIVRKNLLAIVAAYRKATGKSLSDVSREFYGRGDFLRRLKEGDAHPSIDQVENMLKRFRKSWPSDADWPLTQAIFMDFKVRRG
jgi:hypothetical protein